MNIMFCANKKITATKNNGLEVLYVKKKKRSSSVKKKKKHSADSNRVERFVWKIYVKTEKPKIYNFVSRLLGSTHINQNEQNRR